MWGWGCGRGHSIPTLHGAVIPLWDSPALPRITAGAALQPSWQLYPSLREDYTECLQEMLIALACTWHSRAIGHSEL